jgi:hypothetical protein
MRQKLLSIVMAVSLTSCGFVLDEHIDGPYRLVAVDVPDDAGVCYEIEEGCVGRIPATVYAVGFDSKYLVAARHPENDSSRSEYYYLIRALDGEVVDPSVTVRGPYGGDVFAAETKRLGLPLLTLKFSN